MYSFNSCQRFSMGLRSGDSGGVCHQLIPLSSMKDFARLCMYVCVISMPVYTNNLDVCLGSLSCMKRWWSGKVAPRKGRRAVSKIDTYPSASIFPSKMTMLVLPLQLIPAHTWTFTGCLGLCWGTSHGRLRSSNF